MYNINIFSSKGGAFMDKKNKNEVSVNDLESVSGGSGMVGMANPYDTPEKKAAYEQYKNGEITAAELTKILNS